MLQPMLRRHGLGVSGLTPGLFPVVPRAKGDFVFRGFGFGFRAGIFTYLRCRSRDLRRRALRKFAPSKLQLSGKPTTRPCEICSNLEVRWLHCQGFGQQMSSFYTGARRVPSLQGGLVQGCEPGCSPRSAENLGTLTYADIEVHRNSNRAVRLGSRSV